MAQPESEFKKFDEIIKQASRLGLSYTPGGWPFFMGEEGRFRKSKFRESRV